MTFVARTNKDEILNSVEERTNNGEGVEERIRKGGRKEELKEGGAIMVSWRWSNLCENCQGKAIDIHIQGCIFRK